MAGQLFYDDDCVFHIAEQVGPNEHSKSTFHVGEVARYEYQRPSFFKIGFIRFHLRDGSVTSKLLVPAKAKGQFEELIRTIDVDMAAHAGSSGQGAPIGREVIGRTVPRDTSLSPVRSDFSAWVAVDIEWTDSSTKTSICEIGLARFAGGSLVDTWSSYVRPPGDFRIGRYEFETHGIAEELLMDAPILADVWSEVDEFVGNHGWVLHNATQDVNRILATLAAQGHPGPREFQYVDTMLLAKKLPYVTSSNGLDDLAEFFELSRQFATYDQRGEVEDAHGAVEDATLTGEVLNKLMALVSYSELPSFLTLMDAVPGEVRGCQLNAGFSAAGKFKYPSIDQIPREADLSKQVDKARLASERATSKRQDAEAARRKFLEHPNWSNLRVSAGTRVCFTQLMPWDDNREFGFNQEVEKIAKRLGLVEQGVNKQLDLLIVNDPWVNQSAKLRDCLSKGIPVTTYSIFQSNNPEFPVWNYKNAEQYRWLKAQGDWPK
ncbi:exonuclease domain-containing protein [Pontimonas sp.]|nr:exonuclease domain-containing protein [Pontimonas sp.]